MFYLPTAIKRISAVVLVLILGLTSTIWPQKSLTTICIFPPVNEISPNDSLSEICDSLTTFISNEFMSSDTFKVIPSDSIAHLTNLNIYDYEKEIQRQQSYSELIAKWNVEVGIHSLISKSDNRVSILFRAIELPSEIMIHRSQLELASNDSTILILGNNVRPLLTDLRNAILEKKTAWGYPFAADEFGILGIDYATSSADSLCVNHTKLNSLLLQLHSERQKLNIEQLRFKTLNAKNFNWQSDSTLNWQQLENVSYQLDACLTFWMDLDTTSENLNMAFNSKTVAESLQITTIPPFFPSFPSLSSANFSECKELTMPVAIKLTLGTVLWQLEDFNNAEIYLTHVDSMATADTCRMAITHFITSQFYHSLARRKASLGKIDEIALASADRQYSACLTELPSDSGLAAAWLHFNWADVRQRQRAWADALGGFERAKHLFAQNGLHHEAALMEMRVADVYTHQKQWDKVLAICEAALPSFTAIGDCLAVSLTLEKLAPIYELNNEPEKSLAIYTRNANINIALGRHYEAARTYGYMAQVLHNQGDLDKASEYVTKELELAIQLQSEPALARSHFHLGTLYFSMDSTTAAITHLEKAYQTMSMLADTLGMARAMNNIGAVYHRTGQSEEALASYQAALDLSEKYGDEDNQIRSHTNIADLYADQAEWDNAYLHYDQAISLAESHGDMRRAAMVIYSKGLSFVKQGRLRAGYAEVKKAIEMAGGSVYDDPEKEKIFLNKLETLINEIEDMSR